MKHITPAFLITILLGCNGSIFSPDHLINPGLGEEFNLRIGQTATFNDDFSFTFEAVPGDSRCPTNVVCFWSGDAAIVLAFTNESDTLHTHLEPQEIRRDAYDIQLISLSPYPVYPEPIPQDDYVVKLRVTRSD
ncbi:MAG: hypothetical protein K9M19_05665 [Candidatus Marinimicrobia bacterium]|nr:hypothetical protein [Candidatus Neomarinimicrobiota bacterium]